MPNYGHLSLSCAKIERPSPLRKPSCKVRLFAPNRSHKYRQKVTATTSNSKGFSTSLTNGPRSLSQAKVSTHSALLKESHTTAYTPKQGGVRMEWYHYPRSVLRGSETLRGRVSERQTLPLLGLGRGVLPKNAESLRNSDALMRVAVPRRRGPAGLRDLFRFCRNCGFHALRSGSFRVCKIGGGITTLGVLCVLLKRRTAAC